VETESERIERTLDGLGRLMDLKAFGTYIAMFTYGGREPAPQPWDNTRDFMGEQGGADNADKVIALFESAGCKSEIEAVLWLDRHDNSQ